MSLTVLYFQMYLAFIPACLNGVLWIVEVRVRVYHQIPEKEYKYIN